MAVLIDTSVLVDVECGRVSFSALVAAHAGEDVAISAATASELLHGVHRVRGAAKAAKSEAFVEGLLAFVPVLPFDVDEARTHARLSAELRARGTPVGAHDLLIAATAIANDFQLATRDLRSFPRIQGLEILVL